ncbi:hypothetical protein GCM10007298_22540 [Williamsia phyllosphaerae]|uniref:Uncharacterized protein n=1 Tax=Williamsia phyllosphaerae TaxID=885042 RepID=A0ABQ1UT26_9NOCA|nr:hypothetical protein GCM10007298_22540 [Williamsia phyllosphaerae]
MGPFVLIDSGTTTAAVSAVAPTTAAAITVPPAYVGRVELT